MLRQLEVVFAKAIPNLLKRLEGPFTPLWCVLAVRQGSSLKHDRDHESLSLRLLEGALVQAMAGSQHDTALAPSDTAKNPFEL